MPDHHPDFWPSNQDMRYRSWNLSEVRHENSAVIIYMMDVSGSRGQDQKELVRLVSFWIDTWLTSHYRGVERRFIIHDASRQGSRPARLLPHQGERGNAHLHGIRVVLPDDTRLVQPRGVQYLYVPFL